MKTDGRTPHGICGAVVAVLIGLGGGGCSSSAYKVKVDTVARPAQSEAQSYVLRAKGAGVQEDTLRQKEAVDFVRTALSGKGLYEAPVADKADMVIELDYGMEAPRSKVERVSVPVYAQVGGGVRYESVPVRDARGNVSYRTVAVYDAPRTEVVGYDEAPRLVTVYEKYLKITARENKAASEGRPPPELWSIHASTEDESKDMRKYLPIIASASVDFVGQEASQQTTVRVRADGPAVDFIRRGMGEPTGSAASQAAGPKN